MIMAMAVIKSMSVIVVFLIPPPVFGAKRRSEIEIAWDSPSANKQVVGS